MKRFLFALLRSTRVLNLVSWMNRRNVTILSYHSVTDSKEPARHDPHKQQIPLRLFQEHLDHLKCSYRVISLADFLKARRENRPLPDYSVILTFEDGFQDFLTVALHELRLRQLAATVFVITDRAYGRLPPNGESFLCWQEIKELALSGVQVGSHTCSHPRLPDLSLHEVRRELADSRSAILEHIGESEIPLSYPHGETSKAINRLAHLLGYSCGITTWLGPNNSNTDVFALTRTTIASDDDLATFAARVSGLTWWVSRLKQLLGREHDQEWGQDSSPPCGSLTTETYEFSEPSS